MTLVVLRGLKVLQEPHVLLLETLNLLPEFEFGVSRPGAVAVCHALHYTRVVFKVWLLDHIACHPIHRNTADEPAWKKTVHSYEKYIKTSVF